MDTSEEEWRGAFESVFLTALRVTRAVVRHGTASDLSIAWVLSTSVKTPMPGLATSNGLRPGLAKQFAIDDDSVAFAYGKIRAAGECFAAEVQPSGYLVGREFSVADLTLAALLAPLVTPAQFPYPQPQRDHPLLEPAREAVAEAGLLEWAVEMYARHRGRSAEVSVG